MLFFPVRINVLYFNLYNFRYIWFIDFLLKFVLARRWKVNFLEKYKSLRAIPRISNNCQRRFEQLQVFRTRTKPMGPNHKNGEIRPRPQKWAGIGGGFDDLTPLRGSKVKHWASATPIFCIKSLSLKNPKHLSSLRAMTLSPHSGNHLRPSNIWKIPQFGIHSKAFN